MRPWLLNWACAAACALATLWIAPTAAAQHICTSASGAKTFQDVPCAIGQQAEKLTLHQRNSVAPAAPRRTAAAPHTGAAIGPVQVGMTRAQADAALGGAPDTVNSSAYGAVRKDQLVYQRGADTWYVYTDDGIVTAVQHRPGSAPTGPAPRRCPDAQTLRALEVDASRITVPQAVQAESRQRLAEARACQGAAPEHRFGKL
jgi:hypothetical protein